MNTRDIGDGRTLGISEGEWIIMHGTDIEAQGYYEVGSHIDEVAADAIKEWEAGRKPPSMVGVSFSIRWTPESELAVTPHYAGGPHLIRKVPAKVLVSLDQAAFALLGAKYPVMKTEEAGGTCLLYGVMKGDFL